MDSSESALGAEFLFGNALTGTNFKMTGTNFKNGELGAIYTGQKFADSNPNDSIGEEHRGRFSVFFVNFFYYA